MRYFIQLSFNGTNYHGWQIQPNASSVQQTLNEVLSKALQEEIYVVGAGRTDTGVHAKMMFAHFDTDQSIDTEKLCFKLNRMLPPDIALQQIIKVGNEAHARFDATARSYEYHITFAKNPFKQGLALYHPALLQLEAMQEATQFLLDYEDFGAFARSKTQTHTNLCTLKEAYFEQVHNGLIFHITANRFLRNMVRAIVGTLLAIGRSKLSPADMKRIIESKDRKQAGESAAACGLYLTRVEYPEAIINVRN